MWQWNCRSCRSKRDPLQLHLSTLVEEEAPAIIALQETQIFVKIRNYTPQQPTNSATTGVATLVHRSFTATDNPLEVDNFEGHLIELLPKKHQMESLFALSIYSLPKSPVAPLTATLCKALQATGRHPLLVVGAFHASHTSWGYKNKLQEGYIPLDLHPE